MKKLLVTVLAMAALMALLYAPVQGQTKVQAGFKAGLNLANLSGDDVEGLDSKIGFAGGGFLAIDASEQIRIQPELLYTMKGAKDEEQGIDVKLKLNYLEVPVLVKWMIPTQGTVLPSLFIGPAAAFNMSAKVSGEEGGISIDIDIKDEVKDIDFGLIFGGGLDFAAGSGNFILDVRYTLGLSSIDDTDYDDDVKNGAFSAMIGYAFPLGGQ